MKYILCSLFFALASGSIVFAGELDNERGVTNKDTMHGTLILRVDKRTNKAEYVATEKAMPNKDQAKTYSKSATYKKVPAGKIRGELDRNGGSSSWYFYNGYNEYNNGYGQPGYGQPGYGGPGYNNGYNNGYYNGNYGYYNPYCNYYGQNYQPYYSYNQGYYNYYYYGNCNWGGNNGCYRY